jgi:RES domain-containing protein
MNVFRLSRRRYTTESTGKGAATYGARWNSQGVEIIYTADSRALALAEVFVHLSAAMLPDDYLMLTINIPDSVSVLSLNESLLPGNWSDFPYTYQTQAIGDKFVSERKYCVLKVPSSVVKGDFNYLINPLHPEFSQINIIQISDFIIDRRMFDIK